MLRNTMLTWIERTFDRVRSIIFSCDGMVGFSAMRRAIICLWLRPRDNKKDRERENLKNENVGWGYESGINTKLSSCSGHVNSLKTVAYTSNYKNMYACLEWQL